MKKNNSYDNDSISSLKGADRVRKRPSVIFGSDGIDGCKHSIFEIISNSIDEAREGYGDKIVITKFLDNSIEVEDFARGIPVDYNNKEERFNWELVFCEMYAGGKYNNNVAAGSYEYSLGLNGLGLCATQYASEYMDAIINTSGTEYKLHFEHGENIGGLTKTETGSKKNGSRIRWKPDLKVFTDIAIEDDFFITMLKRQAIVNPKITFVFKSQSESGFNETVFYYENGIEDYVKELAEDIETTNVQMWRAERTGRDREDKPDYKVLINAALCFSNVLQAKEYYHNSSWLEHGGAPEKAVRSAFVSQIDSYIKQTNKYTKGESKITWADIEECLVLVVSSFSTQTSYENQTKKAINNKFIQETMTEFFKHSLEVYFIENKADAEKIVDLVLINKRSRERSERERLNIKKTLSYSNDMTNKVAKFVDCRSKDLTIRELFIVEGDSALGACKQARDPDFQAVMPVRGKILNCLKADYTKIFKSDIITDLIKVLGCGVEVNSKNKDMSTFNIDNLKWDKIIICTDADVDGFHIRTLILTMLYRLVPTLIQKEKVYIAETPLFEINTKDKVYFAYDEKEKEKILGIIGDKKYKLQRSKGLGENEPDMMNLTTMNPDTRRIIKVMPSETVKTMEYFDFLMGHNLQGRKDFIEENGGAYLDLLDVE